MKSNTGSQAICVTIEAGEGRDVSYLLGYSTAVSGDTAFRAHRLPEPGGTGIISESESV